MFKKIVFMLLAVVITAIGCSANNKNTKTIKIGFMTDLSGPASPYGLEIQKGAQLAVKEFGAKQINDRGLEVMFEDDQCEAPVGLSIINKFIDIDKIKITGGTVCSSVALAISPIVEQGNVIHFSTAASSPAITSAGEYVFRLWPSDGFEASVMAKYASKELLIKNASILYVNTDFGVPIKDVFSKSFKKNGGKILSVESFDSQETNFKTKLSKIKQNSPDAIYIVPNPKQVPIILKQIKELDIESQILSYGPPIQSEGILESSKGVIEGLYYAHPNQQDSTIFKTKYLEEYDVEPGLGASVGYDTLRILFEAIEYCQGDNPECVKKYLYDLNNYEGASGNISLDENGDVYVLSVVKMIRNGVPVVISK